MLVLSRKQNQTIMIDDRITITVLKIRGNTVRLGIDAPPEVPVRRGELEVDLPAAVVEFRNRPARGKINPDASIAISDSASYDRTLRAIVEAQSGAGDRSAASR